MFSSVVRRGQPTFKFDGRVLKSLFNFTLMALKGNSCCEAWTRMNFITYRQTWQSVDSLSGCASSEDSAAWKSALSATTQNRNSFMSDLVDLIPFSSRKAFTGDCFRCVLQRDKWRLDKCRNWVCSEIWTAGNKTLVFRNNGAVYMSWQGMVNLAGSFQLGPHCGFKTCIK